MRNIVADKLACWNEKENNDIRDANIKNETSVNDNIQV